MESLPNDYQNAQISPENADISVIMVLFPAYGHLNQMLQLSWRISSYGIPVQYVGSAVFKSPAKVCVNGLNPSNVAKIHFEDLPIPPYDSPPLIYNPSSKFPAHLQPAWDATMHMAAALGDFTRSQALKHRRVVVIHNPSIGSGVKDVATVLNAESYAFNCLSAYCQVKCVFEMIGQTCLVDRLRELAPLSTTVSDFSQYYIGLKNDVM